MGRPAFLICVFVRSFVHRPSDRKNLPEVFPESCEATNCAHTSARGLFVRLIRRPIAFYATGLHIRSNIEFFKVIQTKAGKSPQLRFVAASAVNIKQIIPMPNAEGILHVSAQMACGCVPDNRNTIFKIWWVVRLWTCPDTHLGIIGW